VVRAAPADQHLAKRQREKDADETATHHGRRNRAASTGRPAAVSAPPDGPAGRLVLRLRNDRWRQRWRLRQRLFLVHPERWHRGLSRDLSGRARFDNRHLFD
jgi:hypothetical protein